MRTHRSIYGLSKFLRFLVTMLGPSTLFAQPPDSLWMKLLDPYLDGESLLSVCSVFPATEGGFALGGQITLGHSNYMDYWFGKTDSSGNIVLSRPLGRGRFDNCTNMIRLNDGGYMLSGRARIKVDANGDQVWVRSNYPNMFPNDATAMRNGEIAIIYDYMLEKVDSEGDSVWTQVYDINGITPRLQSVLTEEDGGFTLAGYTSYDSTADILLIKTNTLGEEEWHRVYDTGQGDVCYDHLKTIDGGYLLISSSLIKVDSLGREVWHTDFQNSGLYKGLNIDDEFVLADYHFNLVRIDSDGEEVWHTDFEFGRYGHCYSLAETGDGGFIMAGESVLARVGSRQVSVTGNPDVLYPQLLSLSAFPNPFNSRTTISYSLPRPGRYAIDVVDLQGRLVTRLSDGWKEAGSYREALNGDHYSAGCYFIKLNSPQGTSIAPITLSK